MPLLAALLCCRLAAAPETSASEATARRTLAKAVLAGGADRLKLLDTLSDSGSRFARDVLTAWTRDGVFVYQAPDGSKVPVLLEEQQDAGGRARAIRIDDGTFLTDGGKKELRFSSDDLNPVETDMRLRAVLQQSMDQLTLADPDPDARRSAVVKLGNSAKQSYVPILRARLEKESNHAVRKALDEAIAQIQLSSPDPAAQLAAIGRLAQLNAMGSIDSLRHVASAATPGSDTANAARRAVSSIESHIA
ncbi:MAG TPA: hypothetical protein VII09_07475, partial [Opitutaceae bacterium]